MRSNLINTDISEFRSIENQAKDSVNERGSKFIGYLYPITSELDIHSIISQLKSKYPDATHHCYAYRLGHNPIIEFSSDDGEPAGTAGLPILNSLRSDELINTLGIVIRYYGGTNLGKAGLIKAYSGVIRNCIALADKVSLTPSIKINISYPYEMSRPIDAVLSRFNAQVLDSKYNEDILISVSVPISKEEDCIRVLSEMEWQKVTYSTDGHILVRSGKDK